MEEIFVAVFEVVLRLGSEAFSWRFVAAMIPAAVVSAYGFYCFGTPAGWFIMVGAILVCGALGIGWARRSS